MADVSKAPYECHARVIAHETAGQARKLRWSDGGGEVDADRHRESAASALASASLGVEGEL